MGPDLKSDSVFAVRFWLIHFKHPGDMRGQKIHVFFDFSGGVFKFRSNCDIWQFWFLVDHCVRFTHVSQQKVKNQVNFMSTNMSKNWPMARELGGGKPSPKTASKGAARWFI